MAGVGCVLKRTDDKWRREPANAGRLRREVMAPSSRSGRMSFSNVNTGSAHKYGILAVGAAPPKAPGITRTLGPAYSFRESDSGVKLEVTGAAGSSRGGCRRSVTRWNGTDKPVTGDTRNFEVHKPCDVRRRRFTDDTRPVARPVQVDPAPQTRLVNRCTYMAGKTGKGMPCHKRLRSCPGGHPYSCLKLREKW